ncbi:Serine/threonine-protein kinase STY46 [Pelomyxa schiedti]|nr:Serine/threonine-protein kinase STY46 [Pelomyxa schiedti]
MNFFSCCWYCFFPHVYFLGVSWKRKGDTALHLACRDGKVEIVRQLLARVGIHPHIKNKEGKTALECSDDDEVRQLFQIMCPATTTSTAARAVTTPKTAHATSSSPSISQPQTQPQAQTPTQTQPTPVATMRASKVLPKTFEVGCDISDNNTRNPERDRWETEATQLKKDDLTELKARITHLEGENTMNLKLLHDERRCREADQQRFRDLQQHYTKHVMSHVEQGEGTWILPENGKRSQIRIAFEDLPSFDEIVCSSCPLQMVVKLIIARKFGVEPTQQVIFIVGSEHNNSEELLLTDSSISWEDIQQRQQDSRSTNRVVQLKVRIKSTVSIQEKDLKVVSTLGVGSYGTVFKCTFLHNAVTTSSSSSETTTTTFVAVKSLHEAIKSEFNITRFQQEALISSRLRHPNIVRCLGTCITSTGSLWIVSELMELSLRQLLHHKDLTFMEVVAVSSGIAKGMSALHRRNVMHRDLSSNNVLLDSCGTPKLTDFGVSRALQQNQFGSGSNPAPPIGSFTNGAGTPIYLPPQMHTGHYGIKGDMWEFAVLLSELLQGEVPSVKMPKSGAQVTEFMRVQRTSLSPPEIAEVDRICDDIGEIPVVECLGRKIAITSALRSEPKLLNNNVHRACVGLFSVLVESCLSILESDRPSFPAIDKALITCAEIAFTNSGPSTTTAAAAATAAATGTVTTGNSNTATTSDNQDVAGHITRCLANIAASFPDNHHNHTQPSTPPPLSSS